MCSLIQPRCRIEHVTEVYPLRDERAMKHHRRSANENKKMTEFDRENKHLLCYNIVFLKNEK